ncbi:MAG TPA: RNA polymerase sigma factor [Bacteroidales bacterium]|nr:RNA polymerase sigma factor [Bacteroidales bacterium]
MINESYNASDEIELVRAALDGDKSAFCRIVERYRKLVARTIKGMLGDSVYAEDIGQEVFIKLYNSLSDFRGDSKLSTYIQRIAVNLTLNEIKRRKRFFSMFSQRGSDEMYEIEVPDHESPEKRDVREHVEKALQALDPKFRIIVTMRMLQGYSTKETAEILGLPLGTVLSRLSRAQEELKDVLTKMESHEINRD